MTSRTFAVHVSTFADVASDPSVVRTCTDKVIVKHVATAAFSGDLAVVVQDVQRRPPITVRASVFGAGIAGTVRPETFALLAQKQQRRIKAALG